jgi:hypothetical protein
MIYPTEYLNKKGTDLNMKDGCLKRRKERNMKYKPRIISAGHRPCREELRLPVFELLPNSEPNFMIGSIMRFDALSSVTTNSTPLLTNDYLALLESSNCRIDLESIMGCQNWVVTFILKTYSLRDWKMRSKASGTLSLWDLTENAKSIKQGLEKGIADISQQIAQCEECLMNSEGDVPTTFSSEYNIYVVTHAFARAVSILLEVVVSGAYPRSPAIRREVVQSIKAYERCLGDINILHALAWPLTVTGCLAEPDQYAFFQNLISGLGSSCCVGSLGNVEKILQGCWTLREAGHEGEHGVSWKEAMESLGMDLLLV